MKTQKISRRRNISESSMSTENKIALMNVYLSEWSHRDTLLWHEIYTYFYSTLIVILLPNIAKFIGIDLPDLPRLLFPIVGIILSIVFLYICLGYAKRLQAAGDSYQKIINMLPVKYRRVRVTKLPDGKYYRIRYAVLIPWIMFILLIAIALIVIHY